MPPMLNTDDYRKKAYSEIATLPRCLKWLESDVLGPVGANWARLHAERRGLTRTDFLLKDLGGIWPYLIHFDGITPFSVTRDLVSPSFLRSVGRDKLLDFTYPVVLGRAPDDVGVRHYRAKLDKGYSPNRLIDDFLMSKEAKAHMKNIIVDNRKLSELRRAVTEMSAFVYFKNAKKSDSAFFERSSINTAVNETGVDWYLLYKDEASARHLLSPGMNLVGAPQSNGQIQCGLDWVLYGPKIQLPAGAYSIALKLNAAPDFRYHVDASSNGGLTHFFDMDLSGACDLTVDFKVPENITDFEFRLLNTTGKRHLLDLRMVNLKRI